MDDFGDWRTEDTDLIAQLPEGFLVRTRVKLQPEKGLPTYLKSKGAQGFTMGARKPKDLGHLVASTLGAIDRIERKGWTPKTVEIFVRWDPKMARKTPRDTSS